MAVQLKVLTLNCWGIPVICPNRKERIIAIGEELAKGEHDIILLQEIWSQSDYEKLTTKLLAGYPFSHYWHSGMVGSGVCIFSKCPILETFQFRFGLNGYAHKPLHGDWFAGKCVGLAKVLVGDGHDSVSANVYATHTHACYNHNPGCDEYEAHRVAQGFEMSQYIKLTSESCDIVIVAGDFNNMPNELGYKLVKFNADLKDAWEMKKSNLGKMSTDGKGLIEDEYDGHTSGRPDNSFASASDRKFFPTGHRIDYIMYRENSGYSVDCNQCYVTMQKVPGAAYNYSDHDGVAATLSIKRTVTSMNFTHDCDESQKCLEESLPYFDKGIRKVKSDRMYFGIILILSTAGLVFCSDIVLPYGFDFILSLIRLMLVLVIAFSLWDVIVLSNKELSGLMAAQKDVRNVLRNTQTLKKTRK